MVNANEARKRRNKSSAAADRRHARAVRKYERRLDSLVSSMVPVLKQEILDSIDAHCDNDSSITVEHYEYDSLEDKAKVRAYERVAATLTKNPYNFKVERSSREGYNGEGNNMKDFYTDHTWTYSW